MYNYYAARAENSRAARLYCYRRRYFHYYCLSLFVLLLHADRTRFWFAAENRCGRPRCDNNDREQQYIMMYYHGYG